MDIVRTDFPGVYLIKPALFQDVRGSFFESYNRELFRSHGLITDWVQDNQSNSIAGVIRGLHFQRAPYAQAKLVRVLYGRIMDVILDLRAASPTYLKPYAIELSSENHYQLLIPRGFAHGFSVLSQSADVLYKCDNNYHREAEAGILATDPELNIDWKIPAGEAIFSDKDLRLPLLRDSSFDFQFEG